jgi:aminomethyltransferase
VDTLKRTPLSDWHEAHGARMVPFAGWNMPVQYRSIIAEHQQTRTSASIFDICHMGELIISGTGARDGLAGIVTHNLETLAPGRCRYGFMLTPSGGVMDDLIVYRLGEESYMLVVNAACADEDIAWLKKHLPSDVLLDDVSEQTAKIDLQGPLSLKVLQSVLPGDWRMPYFSFRIGTFDGANVTISRTGYTGELGYELYVPVEKALALWKLLEADARVEPAGLGARDTLRLEAGLPLYGHDLDLEHTPVEAGYGSMITSTADFIGRSALDTVRERLIGLNIEGRRSARHGDIVSLPGRSEPIGRVTSGSFAPSLGHCVALAYVQDEFATREEYLVYATREKLTARRTDPPFYRNGTARMNLA